MKQAVFTFFVAAFASLVLAGNEDDLKALGEKLRVIGEKCEKSTGITPEDITTIYNLKNPLAPKVGCIMYCLAKEFNVLKENNMVDKEKLNKLLEPIYIKLKEEKMEKELEGVKSVANDCLAAQQGGTDTCVVGLNATECVRKGLNKAGLFFSMK